jgi:SHS2 domain-containing protein
VAAGPPFYEELEHTADLCIRVWGRDAAELFVHAAQAMFELLRCAPGGERERVTRAVALRADDIDSLLVMWLNELLYLREERQELYDRYRIAELSPACLRAMVEGWSDCPAQRCIKAATFFDLQVTQTVRGYEAVITLDV